MKARKPNLSFVFNYAFIFNCSATKDSGKKYDLSCFSPVPFHFVRSFKNRKGHTRCSP